MGRLVRPPKSNRRFITIVIVYEEHSCEIKLNLTLDEYNNLKESITQIQNIAMKTKSISYFKFSGYIIVHNILGIMISNEWEDD